MSQFTNKVITQADIAFEEHVAKLEQETGLALRDLSLIDMLNALKAYEKTPSESEEDTRSLSLEEPVTAKTVAKSSK